MTGPTARQLEVLRAVCETGSYQAAANRLGITSHTVRNTLQGVYRRLGVRSAAGAAYKLWGKPH